jgi:hypothetical protein
MAGDHGELAQITAALLNGPMSNGPPLQRSPLRLDAWLRNRRPLCWQRQCPDTCGRWWGQRFCPSHTGPESAGQIYRGAVRAHQSPDRATFINIPAQRPQPFRHGGTSVLRQPCKNLERLPAEVAWSAPTKLGLLPVSSVSTPARQSVPCRKRRPGTASVHSPSMNVVTPLTMIRS